MSAPSPTRSNTVTQTIEKVARAIATQRNKEREALSPPGHEAQRKAWRERGPDAGWEFYKSDARAAIEALADGVTPEMVRALNRVLTSINATHGPALSAAIRAALEE